MLKTSQNQSDWVDCEDFMPESAAVIVTYFPDTEAIKNLQRVSGLCDQVIVVDNTAEHMMTSFPKLQNLTVWKCSEELNL